MSDNEAETEAKREEIKKETHGVEDEEKDESELYSRGYDGRRTRTRCYIWY
jgi:hypothetical protein